MNLRAAEAVHLVRELADKLADGPAIEVILTPSFTVLPVVREAVAQAGFSLAGQNLCSQERGAFTGEVSAAMLKDAGCSHVLIGHSERRQLYRETDEEICGKIQQALKQGLRPILCVGETWDERQRGETEAVVSRQIEQALVGVTAEQFSGFIVAYEPVWAIGTGQNATPEIAQAVHHHIRNQLVSLLGQEAGCETRLLYGGSVNAENAGSLMRQEDIDGALVGNASLAVESFYAIINAATERLQGRN